MWNRGTCLLCTVSGWCTFYKPPDIIIHCCCFCPSATRLQLRLPSIGIGPQILQLSIISCQRQWLTRWMTTHCTYHSLCRLSRLILGIHQKIASATVHFSPFLVCFYALACILFYLSFACCSFAHQLIIPVHFSV